MALIFSSKAGLITHVGVVGPCILWKDKLSFEYGNNPLKTGDIIDTVCTQHLEMLHGLMVKCVLPSALFVSFTVGVLQMLIQ